VKERERLAILEVDPERWSSGRHTLAPVLIVPVGAAAFVLVIRVLLWLSAWSALSALGPFLWCAALAAVAISMELAHRHDKRRVMMFFAWFAVQVALASLLVGLVWLIPIPFADGP
jgi:hypothetical protein